MRSRSAVCGFLGSEEESQPESCITQGSRFHFVQAQICLFASGMDISFWCFALRHAAILCKFRSCTDTGMSSHEAFMKQVLKYANLAIWGSPAYVVNPYLNYWSFSWIGWLVPSHHCPPKLHDWGDPILPSTNST